MSMTTKDRVLELADLYRRESILETIRNNKKIEYEKAAADYVEVRDLIDVKELVLEGRQG